MKLVEIVVVEISQILRGTLASVIRARPRLGLVCMNPCQKKNRQIVLKNFYFRRAAL
jgi:hypothetical protein